MFLLTLRKFSKSSTFTNFGFSVSLTKCWASNTAKAAVDNTAASGTGSGNWFGDTSTPAGAAGVG